MIPVYIKEPIWLAHTILVSAGHMLFSVLGVEVAKCNNDGNSTFSDALTSWPCETSICCTMMSQYKFICVTQTTVKTGQGNVTLFVLSS